LSDHTPDLLRGHTEGLLLSLINALNGAYGYRLIKEVELRSRGLLLFKEGTIYPTLRRLESEGLIKGEWQTTPAERKRRFYVITEKGKEALQKDIATWQEFTRTVNLILYPSRI
jgi:PadR family transcriptional regulator PadR